MDNSEYIAPVDTKISPEEVKPPQRREVSLDYLQGAQSVISKRSEPLSQPKRRKVGRLLTLIIAAHGMFLQACTQPPVEIQDVPPSAPTADYIDQMPHIQVPIPSEKLPEDIHQRIASTVFRLSQLSPLGATYTGTACYLENGRWLSAFHIGDGYIDQNGDEQPIPSGNIPNQFTYPQMVENTGNGVKYNLRFFENDEASDLSITISDDYDGGLPDNVLGNSNTLEFGDPVYFLTYQKVGDVTENMTEYAGTYMGNMPDGDLIIATGVDPETGTDISYEGASGSCLFNKEGKIVGNVYAGLNTDLYERPDDLAKSLETTGEIIGLRSGFIPEGFHGVSFATSTDKIKNLLDKSYTKDYWKPTGYTDRSDWATIVKP